MKLTIERAALLKALGHVQSVVERRNTIPILSNVLLAADKDSLSFSATDLDMEIVDDCLAGVDAGGQITAPAHTLYEIVAQAAGRRGRHLVLHRRGPAAAGLGRPLALQPAGAAGRRLPGDVPGRAVGPDDARGRPI